MDYIFFKNPQLRFRKERFGGIAKLGLKTYLLNLQQYKFLLKIKKINKYSSLENYEKEITRVFISEGLFLKVDLEKAKELGFKD